MSSWAFMRHFRVQRDPADPFLDRLKLVQTPWFGLYLHVIHRPDVDPDPHDHPWSFWSVVLAGSYTEHVYSDPGNMIDYCWSRVHKPGRVHRMRRAHAHLITACTRPVITLCLVGPNHGDWRFWTIDGPEPWRAYLGMEAGP